MTSRWYTPQPLPRRQPVGHIGTREAAHVLGCSQQWVRCLIKSGRIPGAERILIPEELRTEEEPRRVRRGLGDWRIPLPAWEAFLRTYRARQGAGG